MSTKQGALDLWTPMHFGSGVLLGLLGVTVWTAFWTSVTFEVLENVLADDEAIQKLVPEAGAESLTNVLGDLSSNMIGYAVGRWLASLSRLPNR